ncbi:hypothetical protein K432DRAFT_420425 [Lepidopterella palustris CBS 459.81]|uniref:Arylsulfotransferase n=1 Tax=Lepidopterella palustris CBS 459.81 TaxID=1314670 RepID=A0A8E2DYQ2_9PEZI|nr:hypothetical protein K432DRAFT_420425 [Lepidopterella palustris CBS 459.81]
MLSAISSCACRASHACFILILLSLILTVFADLDNSSSPTSVFRSRPDLHAPIVTLELLRPELVSPGYVFLAPYRNIDPGPYIYDNDGQLIWSGAGTHGASTAHNPHVCEYQGRDHLCFFQGNQHHGYARGHGVIMDSSYRVVKTIEAAGSASPTDMHEFRLVKSGKSALVTIYQPRPYDLGDYGIRPGLGWIMDSVFQEIDVQTGNLIFEWRSTDHISPSFSYTLAASTDTSGDGLSNDSPWDYFHINSIDKNANGDYLISARHMAAVYKISGQDGHIIWELNGANPTFLNINLHFSSQHHALWLCENVTHTILSLFDNASNTFNITNDQSRGMIVAIDHTERTATMIRNWGAPEPEGILAGSQGNLQLLPNRNVFIGWGDHAYYSEHLDSGEAVMYGKLAYMGSNVMIYRCSKYNWVATPLTAPALWTYSRTGANDSDMLLYTSWNGATEVRSWNFYASDTVSGPFQLVGKKPKVSFETEFRLQFMKAWCFAEAIDGHGNPLRRSAVVRTFVPSEAIESGCDDRGCNAVPPLPEGKFFEILIPETNNRGANYTRGYITSTYYPSLPFLSRTGGATRGRVAGSRCHKHNRGAGCTNPGIDGIHV